MNKQSKGFTIIELLVVIAIIAVLAAIVLVNVTSYISKGRDAAAQGNLASMLTNSAVYYDTNGNYASFITNTSGTAITAGSGTCKGDNGWTGPCQALVGTSAGSGYTVTPGCSNNGVAAACNAATVTNWCAIITLKNGGNTYCVDSTGNKINKASGTCSTTTGKCG